MNLHRVLIVAVTLSGCSAAILSVGQQETSIIHQGSTRGSIVEMLGSPTHVDHLLPPTPLGALVDEDLRVEYLVPVGGTPHRDDLAIHAQTDIRAFTQEQYAYTGRIVRQHDAGEAVAMAGYTFGLSELVMTPAAIVKQKDASSVTHHVTVWYDATGTAVAYLWTETMPDGTPYPNVPERVFKAPRSERVFESSYDAVLSATKAAMKRSGFVVKGEVTGFLDGWRPYLPNSGGGETLNVWIREAGAEKTRVTLRTLLNATGIELQRDWNTEVLDEIDNILAAHGLSH